MNGPSLKDMLVTSSQDDRERLVLDLTDDETVSQLGIQIFGEKHSRAQAQVQYPRYPSGLPSQYYLKPISQNNNYVGAKR